ncbi:chromosome partitioning protein ParA (plasmid) [Candidatus Borreliella tachyglossi]|uniref:Chromosome partitioning protein ParA n=1 Tax=Candidatus Borreliella tachyglossi TaxID=1964448 RepID=A0A2S1LYG1_9SPIR|nr:ParA family protein [Candidatus Borreliella tachyglossi]AWG43338.1 chromosome partitioning protein ParA [Candidatus Borreliella tachyglossi]
MDIKKTKVITIASAKGGVGKSTSSLVFSTLLSRDHEVLLIDLDTQASCTSYYYDKLKEQNIDITQTNIYKVLIASLNINNAIVNINDNLDFLGSYIELHKFVRENLPLKERILKEFLLDLNIQYDYVILDTNPSLDATLGNALICSNYCIVPMTAEKWAVESLELLKYYVRELRIKNMSIFLLSTRFKNNNSHKELLEHIKHDENFLGTVHEREDLNKRIANNTGFDLSKDYIKEYEQSLINFINKIKVVR